MFLAIFASILHLVLGAMIVHLKLPQVEIFYVLIGVAFLCTFAMILAVTMTDFKRDATTGRFETFLPKPIVAILCLHWFAGAVPVLVGSYAVAKIRRFR